MELFAGAARSGLLLGLHASEHIQHRGGDIGVVMDDLPAAPLATIDIGNPVLDADLLAGEFEGPLLDTQFVRRVAGDLDDLLTEPNLAARANLCNLRP